MAADERPVDARLIAADAHVHRPALTTLFHDPRIRQERARHRNHVHAPRRKHRLRVPKPIDPVPGDHRHRRHTCRSGGSAGDRGHRRAIRERRLDPFRPRHERPGGHRPLHRRHRRFVPARRRCSTHRSPHRRAPARTPRPPPTVATRASAPLRSSGTGTGKLVADRLAHRRSRPRPRTASAPRRRRPTSRRARFVTGERNWSTR